MKDNEIGERLRYGNVLLVVEPTTFKNCDGCFFWGRNCGFIRVAMEIGPCSEMLRADKTSVIFKEVKI